MCLRRWGNNLWQLERFPENCSVDSLVRIQDEVVKVRRSNSQFTNGDKENQINSDASEKHTIIMLSAECHRETYKFPGCIMDKQDHQGDVSELVQIFCHAQLFLIWPFIWNTSSSARMKNPKISKSDINSSKNRCVYILLRPWWIENETNEHIFAFYFGYSMQHHEIDNPAAIQYAKELIEETYTLPWKK